MFYFSEFESCRSRFQGCGAHSTNYNVEGGEQFGGFPYKMCYVIGGQECVAASGLQTFIKGTAWRKCTGFQGCQTKRSTRVVSGDAISTTVVGLTVGDPGNNCKGDLGGLLQGVGELCVGEMSIREWSECCRLCSQERDCKHWQFHPNTGECRLYSAVDAVTEHPAYITGTGGGFQDPPLDCQKRNSFDTCDVGPPCPHTNDKDPSKGVFQSPWCPSEKPWRCAVYRSETNGHALTCVGQEDLGKCTKCSTGVQWPLIIAALAGSLVLTVVLYFALKVGQVVTWTESLLTTDSYTVNVTYEPRMGSNLVAREVVCYNVRFHYNFHGSPKTVDLKQDTTNFTRRVREPCVTTREKRDHAISHDPEREQNITERPNPLCAACMICNVHLGCCIL